MEEKIRCTVRVENVKKTSRGGLVIEIVPLNASHTNAEGRTTAATALGSISLEFDNAESAGRLTEIGKGWHLDFSEAPEASKAVGRG